MLRPMAELVVDGSDLVVSLRRSEKFWSFHGDVRVPLASVRRIRIPASPWFTLRGWRVTGVGIPGRVAMGKRRHATGYDFSLVRRNDPAVIVELNGQQFEELTVCVDDPLGTGRRIAVAAGIAFDPTPDRGVLG
jgi:hypothetical protein